MNHIVAHFKDGRVIKGTSLAVDPAKPVFPLRPKAGKAIEIAFKDLKALFFVRSLDGNSSYQDSATPVPGDPRTKGSTLVKLEFDDGEVLTGLVNAYPPIKQYFYLNPADLDSNNIRILVNRGAVRSMDVVS